MGARKTKGNVTNGVFLANFHYLENIIKYPDVVPWLLVVTERIYLFFASRRSFRLPIFRRPFVVLFCIYYPIIILK